MLRVCNLWEATSCRANTTYTETVSIVYSVPSSLCVPNCVLPVCSLLFTLFPVPSVFPIVSGSPFPLLFSVCFYCVPDCVRCSFCGLHCSQCSLLNPVLLMCSLFFPMCVPIIHSVFPVPLITSVYLCVCAA